MKYLFQNFPLAIILTKPKTYQAVIIGLLVGLVSQIPMLNATPMVNFASEALGGLVCGLLDAPCLNVSVPAAVELAAVKVERNAYGVAHFYGCVGGGHTVRAEDGQGNLLGVVLLSLNNVHAFLPGISGARSALLDGALLDDFSD